MPASPANTLVVKIPPSEAEEQIKRLGADPASFPIFRKKSRFLCFKIYSLPCPAANILKQELLAAGGDAAVHRHVVDCRTQQSDVVVMATEAQLERVCSKLELMDYWGLPELASKMRALMQEGKLLLRVGERVLDLTDRVLIMGILNVTPDSFYAGSRAETVDEALRRAERMLQEGADIIDVGGESTRPGSEPVPLEEEMERVIPVIKELRKRTDVLISVDTYKAEVAEAALQEGADIVNDISGLRFDPKMAEVVAESRAALVLMHIKGRPKDMQKNPHYGDLLRELLLYFQERLEFAERAGIDRERIVIDPGIGFGKRFQDNLEILRNIEAFRSLGRPVLIGHSRKSFIGQILDLPPEERLEGSLVVTAWAVQRGASIIRVHDVAANLRAIKVARALANA